MESTKVTTLSDEEVELQIRDIFNQNKIHDLRKFIDKRACLNRSNQLLNYLFHIIQSAGVLTTTIAAGYDMKELVWIGVGMNIVASLINVFEKSNDAISKRVFKDIHAIKNGTYVDEGTLVEIDDKPATAETKKTTEDIESQQKPNVKKVLNVPLISDSAQKQPNKS
jgi:hypothetical protein